LLASLETQRLAVPLTLPIIGLIRSLFCTAIFFSLVAMSPKIPEPCFSACSGCKVIVTTLPFLAADSNFLI
jgi:hypothetical protein